jgi:hypothetical protein
MLPSGICRASDVLVVCVGLVGKQGHELALTARPGCDRLREQDALLVGEHDRFGPLTIGSGTELRILGWLFVQVLLQHSHGLTPRRRREPADEREGIAQPADVLAPWTRRRAHVGAVKRREARLQPR